MKTDRQHINDATRDENDPLSEWVLIGVALLMSVGYYIQ